MKKQAAFLLALALAASTGVSALAEDTSATNQGGNTNIPVTGSFQASDAPADSIKVDIAWENMTFVYTEAEKTWNPATHEYTTKPGGWTWQGTGSTTTTDTQNDEDPSGDSQANPFITLTNHSNVAVNAGFTFTREEGIGTGTVGEFFDENGQNEITALSLDSAVGVDENHPVPTAQLGFHITGDGITKAGKLGTININITKKTTDTPDPTPGDGGDEGDTTPVSVSDEESLVDALNAGKSVQLTGDITLTSQLALSGYTGTIDLDNHTLTLNRKDTARFALWIGYTNCTIQNGTIKGIAALTSLVYIESETSATIKNCTIENTSGKSDSPDALKVVGYSDVTLENCTIKSTVGTNNPAALKVGKDAVVTLKGNTNITCENLEDPCDNLDDTSYGADIICQAGTYNFNPDVFVSDDFKVNKVTDEAGTRWVVSSLMSGGTDGDNPGPGTDDGGNTNPGDNTSGEPGGDNATGDNTPGGENAPGDNTPGGENGNADNGFEE